MLPEATGGVGDDAADLDAAFEAALKRLRAGGQQPLSHLIDGRSVPGGVLVERKDPVDCARTISTFHEAPLDLILQAVAAARAGQPAWRHVSVARRAETLHATVTVLDARRAELAAQMSAEIGKTRTDGHAEIDEAIRIVDLYCSGAANGADDGAGLGPMPWTAGEREELKPFGTFGVLGCSSCPLAPTLAMAVAALLAGNAVVIKPSELAPRAGQAVIDVLLEAGLPSNVVHLVHGSGDVTGYALAASGVDGVAFAGSSTVGWSIVSKLQEPPYPRPVIAEMGGKNAAIVCESADIDCAAASIARSAFGLTGQRPAACSRAITVGTVYDRFLERLSEQAQAARVGDPKDRSVEVGPLIDEAAMERFDRAVNEARARGRVVVGGGRPAGAGHFVDCTVIGELPEGDRLEREELQLPIITVRRAATLDLALNEANATRYGLYAGIFSSSEAEVDTFLEQIEAGVASVNDGVGAAPGTLLLNGWKASSAHGRHGFGAGYTRQFARPQRQRRHMSER